MSFSKLYSAVQDQKGVISTKWLKDQAVALSHITKVKEQWTSVIDPLAMRGFYIEGPLGPPVPLEENECLIVISRAMCMSPLGDHWRRAVYTKELMHVFDEPDEKADTPEKFDIQIEKFGDPNKATSPQYRAEQKAAWRSMMVLCPEAKRLEYKGKIAANEISYDVVASALRVPVSFVRDMMRPDFEEITAKLR
ncbi:MAG: hypothetical protein JO261_11400 [Alphaproteobacteria bacterium]|nr:hypothetical protein [Alphaproteobacteria bacterium]MBV9694294.1 hypothetical protein [Alphaproteobacteria bacterium]